MKELDNCYYIDDVEKVVAMIKNMKKPLLNSGLIKNAPISSISLKETVEEKTITIDLCNYCRGNGSYANWVEFDDGFLDSMYGKTVKFVRGTKVELTTDVKTKTLFISCGEQKKKITFMYKEESFGGGTVLNSDLPTFAQKEHEDFPNRIYIMECMYDKEVTAEIFDDVAI